MDHFNCLYGLDSPDWNFAGYCFGSCGGKRARMPHTNFHAFVPHNGPKDNPLTMTPAQLRKRKYPSRVRALDIWRIGAAARIGGHARCALNVAWCFCARFFVYAPGGGSHAEPEPVVL